MANLDLEHVEQRLLEERRQTLESLQRAEEEGSEGHRESGGALSRVPDHLADAASDTQEEEKDMANIVRESEQLTRIDEALRSLRDDPERYGICERCGRSIEPERLDLVPWAALCARCAREVEAGGPAVLPDRQSP